uniref:TGF_BETA_2 domain-containing protein n=1 Tax=Macrostomum lignano TaxID=282301 RepID=A0A1I8JQG8_9PLAT
HRGAARCSCVDCTKLGVGEGRPGRSGAVPYHSDSVVAYADWDCLTRVTSGMPTCTCSERLPSVPGGIVVRRPRSVRRHPRIIKLKLYQVTDPRRRSTPYGNILLSQKLLPRRLPRWVVFQRTTEVGSRAAPLSRDGGREWRPAVSRAAPLYASVVRTADSYWLRAPAVPATLSAGLAAICLLFHAEWLRPGPSTHAPARHLVQRGRRIGTSCSRRLRCTLPMATRRSITARTKAFDSFDPNRYASVYSGGFRHPVQSPIGEVAAQSARAESAAAASQFRVDFATVGWDEWIIGPSGFQRPSSAAGSARSPLGQQFHPSNHAVVQRHHDHLGPHHQQARCRSPAASPASWDVLNMLYYDDNERVVLKQYDDMVALACGCHSDPVSPSAVSSPLSPRLAASSSGVSPALRASSSASGRVCRARQLRLLVSNSSRASSSSRSRRRRSSSSCCSRSRRSCSSSSCSRSASCSSAAAAAAAASSGLRVRK